MTPMTPDQQAAADRAFETILPIITKACEEFLGQQVDAKMLESARAALIAIRRDFPVTEHRIRLVNSVTNKYAIIPANLYTALLLAGVRVVPDVWRAASTWERAYAEDSRLMLSLWRRLPLEHRRTRGWLRQTFVHLRRCYHHPENQLVLGKWAGPEWSKTLLVWPGGTFGHTPFGTIKKVQFEVELARKFGKYDELAPDAQAKFAADIEAENARVTRLCTEVATVDNMDAVSGVRRWYPGFTPEPWLLAEDLRHGGEWWTRRAHPPKPGNCPGFSLDSQHPANTTWCQTCGWYADGKMADEDISGE